MQLRKGRKRRRSRREIPVDDSEEEDENVDHSLRRKISGKKISSIESDEDIE